jgi:gp45 sliding clamp, C terminal
MKISKETMAILKNFSGINSNILIRPGNKLATIATQKNVLAEVSVTETFPCDFGIYDLSEFLGAVSLFGDPDIEFSEKSVRISEGRTSIRYVAADPSVLTVPPEKKINFPDPDVVFEMSSELLNRVHRTASVLKATDMSVIGQGGELIVSVSDIKNPLGNALEEVVGVTNKTFRANIKVDNLKMVQQDYTVHISSKKISKWQAVANDMLIFVAIEANSTF